MGQYYIYYFEIRVESLLWVNPLGSAILGNHWLVGVINVLTSLRNHQKV